MPLSPLLSNFFLGEFDLAVRKQGLNMIRYADDIIVFCDSKQECEVAEVFIRQRLDGLGLGIPPLGEKKTFITPPEESALFLGVHLKKRDNEYVKAIPQNTVTKILENKGRYKDMGFCLDEKLNFAGAISMFKNQLQGYRASYKGTENLDSFIQGYEAKSKQVVEHLLMALFGENVVKSLSEQKRKFLGLFLP